MTKLLISPELQLPVDAVTETFGILAVKRAGKQGHDGYFDVKCFDAQANACAQYLKAGREIAVDGRLLFDEFQTQDGAYAPRVYIVAERVEFLASRNRTNGQADTETPPASRSCSCASRTGGLTLARSPQLESTVSAR